MVTLKLFISGLAFWAKVLLSVVRIVNDLVPTSSWALFAQLNLIILLSCQVCKQSQIWGRLWSREFMSFALSACFLGWCAKFVHSRSCQIRLVPRSLSPFVRLLTPTTFLQVLRSLLLGGALLCDIRSEMLNSGRSFKTTCSGFLVLYYLFHLGRGVAHNFLLNDSSGQSSLCLASRMTYLTKERTSRSSFFDLLQRSMITLLAFHIDSQTTHFCASLIKLVALVLGIGLVASMTSLRQLWGPLLITQSHLLPSILLELCRLRRHWGFLDRDWQRRNLRSVDSEGWWRGFANNIVWTFSGTDALNRVLWYLSQHQSVALWVSFQNFSHLWRLNCLRKLLAQRQLRISWRLWAHWRWTIFSLGVYRWCFLLALYGARCRTLVKSLTFIAFILFLIPFTALPTFILTLLLYA